MINSAQGVMKRVQKQLFESFNNSPAQTKLSEWSPNNRNQTSLHEEEATGFPPGKEDGEYKAEAGPPAQEPQSFSPGSDTWARFPGQTWSRDSPTTSHVAPPRK